MLSQEIYVPKAGLLGFHCVSEYIALLDSLRDQRLNLHKLSVQADILNRRHTNEPLASVLPMNQFIEADTFLFLRSAVSREIVDRYHVWRPWSTVYGDHERLRFLEEAASRKYAEEISRALGAPNADTFKARFPGSGAMSRGSFFRTPLWFLGTVEGL